MSVHFEREVKLPFATPAAARAAVLALGATPLRGRRLQSDTLFDNGGVLSARRAVLRVRRDADTAVLTFKNPAEHPTVKLREEIETAIGDAGKVVAILEQIGFVPWFSYEKFREEFTYGDAIVAIDETPVGTYVEVEGTDAGIAAAAAALGRGPADYVLDSYRTLFVRYCAERGISAAHMLFSVLGTPVP
jgi:adenylate cyclase class 2